MNRRMIRRKVALFVLAYAAAGFLWLTMLDRVIDRFDLRAIEHLGDVAFVLVSAGLLYVGLTRRSRNGSSEAVNVRE